MNLLSLLDCTIVCAIITSTFGVDDDYFTKTPKNAVSVVGGTVTFECKLKNSANEYWKKYAGLEHSINLTELACPKCVADVTTKDLVIKNVGMSDAGVYGCVDNITDEGDLLGKIRARALLSVFEALNVTYNISLSDNTVTEGTRMKIMCRAIYASEPHHYSFALTWTPTSLPVERPVGLPDNVAFAGIAVTAKAEKQGRRARTNLKRQQGGKMLQFTCILTITKAAADIPQLATNDVTCPARDCVVTTPAFVVVAGAAPSAIKITPPCRTILDANSKVVCSASGSPDPSYTWTFVKDSKVVSKSSEMFVKDSGEYTCTATNIKGSTTSDPCLFQVSGGEADAQRQFVAPHKDDPRPVVVIIIPAAGLAIACPLIAYVCCTRQKNREGGNQSEPASETTSLN